MARTVFNVEWEGLQDVSVISACSVAQRRGNSAGTEVEKKNKQSKFLPDAVTERIKHPMGKRGTHVLLWTEFGLQLTLADLACVPLPWKSTLL